MPDYTRVNLKEVEDSAGDLSPVVRGFEGGPDGLELIAIGADRPEGGDGVRVAEWWSKP